MKIAGGLTIVLVLGALETLQALSTPFSKVGVGADVSFDKKKGLALKQTDNTKTESHKHSESKGSSHVTGSNGSEYDSEYKQSNQEDKTDETKNTRELNIGGDGGLNYANTKETSGTSQQIAEDSSRTREKTEESKGGYYHKKESKNEEKGKHVKNESFEKKESSGFQLGKGGFQKGKTEVSEKSKTSETDERSSRNQELEEESIQEGDKRKYKKSKSEVNNASKSSNSSEISRQSSSDIDGQNDDPEKTGAVDNLNGNNVNDPSKLRRKRHTVYESQNENNEHKEEPYYTNYGSEQGHLTNINENHRSSNEHYGAPENINRENHHSMRIRHGNENAGFRNVHRASEANNFSENEHYGSNYRNYKSEEGNQYSAKSRNQEHGSNNGNYNLKLRNSHHYSLDPNNEHYRNGNHKESAFHYRENPAINLQRSENANEYSANRNYGSINSNYNSENTNHYSVRSRNGNSNENYGHRIGNQYLATSGKGNYRSNYGRSNNQFTSSSQSNESNGSGQSLKKYSSSGNSNVESRGRSYRLGNENYGSVLQRIGNSRSINSARNYIYGSRHYRFGNGFKENNEHARKTHSYIAELQNGDQQAKTARYRQGVRHEDVFKFLSNNGRRVFNKYQDFNTGNPIPGYEQYNTGYRPSSNGYSRGHEGFNTYVAKNGKNNVVRGTLGAIDLHHFMDNTHYSTGNGRFVFIPGKDRGNHCYYDTVTGRILNVRKITLHGGKHVIVPSNYAGYPGSNGSPGVDHDNSGHGLDLGFGISYIGGGKYKHQDQIIPATKIGVYLKTLGISSVRLTSDGLPLGLSSGHFPLNLGSGITYQGDGTYKYQDIIIPYHEIIEFCKSKHINNISFTKDGFPEDLLNGSLDNIFKNHLTLPIHLGKGLYFIANGHYKWEDQIIPAVEIAEFIKEHDLNNEITEEGLPFALFDGTLGIKDGSTIDKNLGSNEDEHFNPHGIFPYDVGSNILYDGKGNYIYQNITIPRSNIIEFCKSHDLTNISLTDDGFPAGLFNNTEHGEIGPNLKYPIYLGEDLYYIESGHYKYKNQIILASDIGEFLKKHKINAHITKEGLPLALYVGSLDNVYSPDENDGLGPYENGPLNYHESYPLNLGSNLSYLGNGSYIYDYEIIGSNDIIEFCKSHSITNISFTYDGFPASLFNNTENDVTGSQTKFPIDLGQDLFYYKCGHYRHNKKTIPAVDIVEYIKENKLNVSVTDYGLPSKLVEENFDRGLAPYENEVSGVHKNVSLDIYGDFPYDLGSNISYLGDGSYRCNNEIIYSSDIINYCKSHNINDIVFTEDGFPASFINKIVSDERSNKKFPIELGKGLRFLGCGHYEYENKIYPAGNITDVINNLNLNISLNDDGIPFELLGEKGHSSSEDNEKIIDLGEGLFYDHGKYTYHNETIPADKIIEFCKGLNLNISFTEDGYPQLYNDEQTALLHESSECPKGPIDLGEEIIYIGDCNYMYQDHVIPSKYILGLLDILHIHDIQLPVGPNDEFTSKADSNDTDSKDDYPLDLGFDVFDLGNRTYKYKNYHIPVACYADFLKILGLKTQPGSSEKLVEDNPKSDRNEDDILTLIDKLLKNEDKSNTTDNTTDSNKTTDTQSTSTNDGNTPEDTDGENNSSNDDGSHTNQHSSNPGGPRKSENVNDNGSSSTSDSGDTTTSSTYKNSSKVKDSSQSSTSNSNKSDSSSGSSSGSNNNSSSSTNSSDSSSRSKNIDSVTSSDSSDSTNDDTSSSTNSPASSSTSNDNSTSDSSFGNSSSAESDLSSISSSNGSSSSNDTTASSNNSSITSGSSSSNSSSIENRDSSTTSSSSGSSSSDDTTTSSNDIKTTTDNSSDNSSNTESKDSSRADSDDSSSSDNSSSNSYNDSTTSDSSSGNSSSTENSNSSKTSSSSNSTSSSSSNDTLSKSDDIKTKSDISSDNSSNTESNDSSRADSDDSSSSDHSSSNSYKDNTTSDSSSGNSSSTENSNSSKTSSSSNSTSSSSSNDTLSKSDDIKTKSDISSDNSSNTESNDSSRADSDDSSSSDHSSSNSYKDNTTSDSSSGNSSSTQNSNLSKTSSSNNSSSSNDTLSNSDDIKTKGDNSSNNSSNTENKDTSGTNSGESSTDRSSSDDNSNNGSTTSGNSSNNSSRNENNDSSTTSSSGGSSSSGDRSASKDSSKEKIEKSRQRNSSKKASSSEVRKEEKEKDSKGNTKIKKSSSSTERKSKEESTKEHYKKTDEDGNKESYNKEKSSKSSKETSVKSSSEKNHQVDK